MFDNTDCVLNIIFSKMVNFHICSISLFIVLWHVHIFLCNILFAHMLLHNIYPIRLCITESYMKQYDTVCNICFLNALLCKIFNIYIICNIFLCRILFFTYMPVYYSCSYFNILWKIHRCVYTMKMYKLHDHTNLYKSVTISIMFRFVWIFEGITS